MFTVLSSNICYPYPHNKDSQFLCKSEKGDKGMIRINDVKKKLILK